MQSESKAEGREVPQPLRLARPDLRLAERMGASRYDDSDRLQFLIDRPGLTLIYAKTEFRWAVVDLETQGMVSRWHGSARDSIDDAIEYRQLVQGGLRPL